MCFAAQLVGLATHDEAYHTHAHAQIDEAVILVFISAAAAAKPTSHQLAPAQQSAHPTLEPGRLWHSMEKRTTHVHMENSNMTGRKIPILVAMQRHSPHISRHQHSSWGIFPHLVFQGGCNRRCCSATFPPTRRLLLPADCTPMVQHRYTWCDM